MKINFLICLLALSACINKPSEKKENIITKETFKEVLQDIHVAEANYEIEKNKDLKNALNNLKSDCSKIYKQYSITQKEFNNSLHYYTNHPEILEEIYNLILQDLENEKSTIDH